MEILPSDRKRQHVGERQPFHPALQLSWTGAAVPGTAEHGHHDHSDGEVRRGLRFGQRPAGDGQNHKAKE